MSVSAVGSAPAIQTAPKTAAPSQTAKAADGDYLAAGPGRSKTKDADGDYKPTASAQASSSSAVQAAVSGLKLGGSASAAGH